MSKEQKNPEKNRDQKSSRREGAYSFPMPSLRPTPPRDSKSGQFESKEKGVKPSDPPVLRKPK
jgi:hypothetical protein